MEFAGGGGPKIGEGTCSGSLHLSCKRDQIKMRDYMDRRVTPPKRATSPNWGPPPPYKQALIVRAYGRYIISVVISRILWVPAIMKKGKARSVMSKYYRPKDLLRDLFLLLIKIRHILFHPVQPLVLSSVVRGPTKNLSNPDYNTESYSVIDNIACFCVFSFSFTPFFIFLTYQ